MRAFVACLLFVFAGAFIAYDYFDLAYWTTPPEKRLTEKWQKEIARVMSKSKKISKELLLLKEIEITVTDPQFVEFIEKAKRPYKTTPKGTYILHVEIIPSINGLEYGFDMQHDITDTRTNNKVNEFGISLPIGKLW